MTGTPPDGRPSCSFSSMIGFDDLPQREHEPLGYPGIFGPKMTHRVQFASDKSAQPTYSRGIIKPYPRLELDVALDEYHCLDGFTEPVSPRNTPASASGGLSPEVSLRPVDAQAMRTSSAPQIQSLAFEWLDGKSEGDLACFEDNTEVEIRTQRRRFSADDGPCAPSTIIPLKDIAQTSGSGSMEETGRDVPCMRSSPPPASPKPHSPPANRLLDTVDRNVDDIASHRLRKYYRKWRSPSRAFAQRVSPCRSPPKTLKARFLYRHSDGPLSALPPHSSHHEYSRDQATQTDPIQATVEEYVSERFTAVPAGTMGCDVVTSPPQVSNLVGLSISIHRVQRPGQQSAPTSSGRAFRVEMTSNPVPLNISSRRGEVVEHSLNHQALKDLIFHTYLVLPASVARFPNAIFSIMQRVCNSRIGLTLLYLEKLFWSLVIALFFGVLNKFRRPGKGAWTGSRIPNAPRH